MFPEVFEERASEPYGHFILNTATHTLSRIDTAPPTGYQIDPVAFAYDFGARMYDARIGRFTSVDPYVKDYPTYSPYSFAGNSPVLFIDKGGRYIANSNDADAIYLKEVLQKTDAGKIIYHAMENSGRAIYIYIATYEGDEVRESLMNYFQKGNRPKGQIINILMFDKIINGEMITDEDIMQSYDFDPNTGEYTKNSIWDATYIIINSADLQLDTDILNAIMGNENDEVGKDISMIRIGGEEAVHSLQEFGDFHEKKKDPTTNLFVQPDSTTPIIPYDNRRHEKEAKEKTATMENEYLNSR